MRQLYDSLPQVVWLREPSDHPVFRIQLAMTRVISSYFYCRPRDNLPPLDNRRRHFSQSNHLLYSYYWLLLAHWQGPTSIVFTSTIGVSLKLPPSHCGFYFHFIFPFRQLIKLAPRFLHLNNHINFGSDPHMATRLTDLLYKSNSYSFDVKMQIQR